MNNEGGSMGDYLRTGLLPGQGAAAVLKDEAGDADSAVFPDRLVQRGSKFAHG